VNPKSRGELSEGLTIAHLLKNGYSLSMPFGDNQRYDLIVDDGERLHRAQVKTARLRDGVLRFNCCSTNVLTQKRTHYKGQIDVFLAYSPDLDRVYWVPVEDAPVTEMCLRVDAARSGKGAPSKMASDYELVGRLGLEPRTDTGYKPAALTR
jgi:hypothetical protein